MKHLSLFSGIGGLDLAAEWAGFETVAFVERDPYCQRVLAKHWPGVPILGDVRLVADAASLGRPGLKVVADEGRALERAVAGASGGAAGGDSAAGVSQRRRVDPAGEAPLRITLVSGGFPCQPHSVAGKRGASADDRDLWPEFARVIREIRPRWVVAENVPGLLSSESGRFFGTVLRDLAEMGYSAGWGVWGACDVGALHRRDRVFIVAHAGRVGREGLGDWRGPGRANGASAGRPVARGGNAPKVVSDAWHAAATRLGEHCRQVHGEPESIRPDSSGSSQWWAVEPDVGRVAHGVPARVDRLRALGNAVVPQQAYPLFRAIAEIELARLIDGPYANGG